MKKLSLVILAATALTATAQHKIDNAGRRLIDETKQLQLNGGITADHVRNNIRAVQNTYPVIVECSDASFDFEAQGFEVVSRIGDMFVISATPSQMEDLAALDVVRRVSLGNELRTMMNFARPAGSVEEMQQGAGSLNGVPYTGKGVIASLFDTGLDVNHINFIGDDGQPRTKYLVVMDGGRATVYDTPSSIGNFPTEKAGETHGTHVLGIMAGSYNGPSQYVYINSSNKQQKVEQTASNSANPFYGVATGADIAVGCGNLTESNMIVGVQKIVDYAKSQNKPCVVNLSIGNNIGPHDGTDAFSQAMDIMGQDAIICFASGNEGDENISISTTGEPLKTFYGTNNKVSGICQFWASDSQVFDFQVVGYDKGRNQIVFSYDLNRNLAGSKVTQSAMNGFNTAFSGTLNVTSNIDPVNNRYNIEVNASTTGKSNTIVLGFIITPKAGQTVDGFSNDTNGAVFASQSIPGYTDGSPANSVNGLACGKNVIVVGSYCTKASWPVLPSGTVGYNPRPTVGGISSFSSYGKVFNGRNLPDVCAPGEGITASVSQYYVQQPNNDVSNVLCAIYTAPSGFFARNSSWATLQGTSMASPYVAGVITAWLEADPTLKVSDVLDIIGKTSSKDLYVNSDPEKWGAGKINALNGVIAVLERKAGVNDIAVEPEAVIVNPIDGRNFDVFVAGANRVEAALYTLSGVLATRCTADDSRLVVAADGCDSGLYIMKLATDKGTFSRKVVVK